MVHGYPLQYCSFPPAPYQPYRTYDYYNMTDISEDILIPSSPHSVQSDSDNSMSSTDVSTNTATQKTRISSIMSPVKLAPAKIEITDVKCGWQQCGLWFESLDMLANHVSKAHASSGPNGLFYCGWEGCSRNNKGFNARYKMLVHVRTHTNQKPHQCCQCDKSFSRAENLKIHSRSHSGEKPYVCPVPGCNKAYSNSSDRFKHSRTHQVEKPYLCKVPGCNKRYTDPSSLRKHVKTYKHFVNNEPKNLEPIVESTNKFDSTDLKFIQSNDSNKFIIFNENINMNQSFIKSEKIYSNENLINNHKCSCPQTCCLKTCLTRAAELLKLGALINFNGHNIENVTWNKLLDPLMQQSNKIYPTYNEQMQMDIDTPLDLTVHRK